LALYLLPNLSEDDESDSILRSHHMPASGYSAYQRVQVETSTPAQLVLQLYDALMRDLERASAALDGRAVPEQAHNSLVHAQEIVIELLASLDMNSGDLAQHLADLYQYMYRRLVTANVAKDQDAVSEVLRLLKPIHAAWAEATRTTPSSAPEPRRFAA
jgi:flagellar secretion chaperone FliS